MRIKIAMLSLLMLAGVVVAEAQGGGGGFQRRTPEERTKRAVDTISSVFKLDASQQTQVKGAYMDYYNATDKMMESMQSGTRPDRAEFEKLSADRDEKLKKVLTEEQFKKFKEEIEPAMRPRRGGMGGGRMGGQGQGQGQQPQGQQQ